MARSAKVFVTVVTAALAVSASAFAPLAGAGMRMGNYEVLTDRWNDHSWIWTVLHSCGAPDCGTYLVDPVAAPATDTLNVRAIPRPLKSQSFQQSAFFTNGQYTLTVDVLDGVRCIGYNLPSHDVYSWGAASLAGTIVSTYDAGCYGTPGGTDTYAFALRLF